MVMGFACLGDFVSFGSFRPFQQFRFGRFSGFVMLFPGVTTCPKQTLKYGTVITVKSF